MHVGTAAGGAGEMHVGTAAGGASGSAGGSAGEEIERPKLRGQRNSEEG